MSGLIEWNTVERTTVNVERIEDGRWQIVEWTAEGPQVKTFEREWDFWLALKLRIVHDVETRLELLHGQEVGRV